MFGANIYCMAVLEVVLADKGGAVNGAQGMIGRRDREDGSHRRNL